MSQLPETVILGMQDNEWPVHCFVADEHAIVWVSGDPRYRKLWRVDIANVRRLRYVPPGEATLAEEREVPS